MAAIASASQAGVEAVGVRAVVARPPVALIAAALLGVTLVLLPILYTIAEAGGVDFRDALGLLFRPLVGRLLFNTVSLVIAASLASAVIGTAAAWLVERTDLPGRNVWSVLIAAPPRYPTLHHELRLGFDEQCASGLRRSAACRDLRLLSARVLAGGRRLARARSSARGDRALSRREPLGMFRAGRPSPASPGPSSAARCSSPSTR
jgi:hypothetical protein